jgi:hypothetical protein
MHALDESDLLLDLLREAGDEPVTLDELQIVGVRSPADALLALELAGHAVHRVYDNRTPCVRLGPPPAPMPTPTPAPIPVQAASGPDARIVLVALIGALVLFLLARRD